MTAYLAGKFQKYNKILCTYKIGTVVGKKLFASPGCHSSFVYPD